MIKWETEDEVHEFPSKFEVCGQCRGNGTHVNQNIDGNGLSQEDFDEDPDFRENYFSGVYDITCLECKGLRVVEVIDEDRADKDLLAKYYEHLEEERQYQRLCEMERRMGA